MAAKRSRIVRFTDYTFNSSQAAPAGPGPRGLTPREGGVRGVKSSVPGFCANQEGAGGLVRDPPVSNVTPRVLTLPL